MSDKIKLSELVAAREPIVHGGPWKWEIKRDPETNIATCPRLPNGVYRRATTVIYDDGDSFTHAAEDGSPADWDDAYAEYVVKMHNAADVLIEIAQAALVAIELNPNTQVFREAMRDLRAACAKVQP